MPCPIEDDDRDVMRVDVLEARQIRLVDQSGKERASLSSWASDKDNPGGVVLQLHGENGLPRVELQVDGGGCSVRLNTKEDAQGITLSINDGVGTGIGINNHNNYPCIRIGISHPDSNDPRGNHPEVTMYEGDEQRTWMIDS